MTLSILLLYCLAAVQPAVWAQSASQVQRITTVSSVRVRTSPQTSAEEIFRFPLGTIVDVLEQSITKEKIGEVEDFWYRVRATDQKSGWIFGGLTAVYTAAKLEELSMRIAAERLKTRTDNFAEQVELYEFLAWALPKIRQPAVRAELELSQLLALSNSLRAIPFNRGNQDPFASWLKTHNPKIVHDDPSGMWLVRLDRFWELEKKYHALPIGERIAWQAARYEMPGECEGDLICYFRRMELSEGVYLRLHPAGAHVGEAIGLVDEVLKYIIDSIRESRRLSLEDQLPQSDRAEFRQQIARFRAVLMKVSHPKNTMLLSRLDQLASSIP